MAAPSGFTVYHRPTAGTRLSSMMRRLSPATEITREEKSHGCGRARSRSPAAGDNRSTRKRRGDFFSALSCDANIENRARETRGSEKERTCARTNADAGKLRCLCSQSRNFQDFCRAVGLSLLSLSLVLDNGEVIVTSSWLINPQSAMERRRDSDRYTNGYRSTRYRRKQGGGVHGSRRGSRNPRSRDHYRVCSPRHRCAVVRSCSPQKAAEKCFRTNWRALIDETTESFPRNRESSAGRFITVTSVEGREREREFTGYMKSAMTPPR